MAKQYWLMKSEPDAFGIDDLQRVKREPWTGVRNFQARNYMRDGMKVGDDVLFYHSNATPPGVAGLACITTTGVVDATQFDPESPYYDPKATHAAPTWICVEVEFVAKFAAIIALDELRDDPRLADILVTRRGSRLSVQPVSAPHYKVIVEMATAKPSAHANAGQPPVKSTTKGKPAARKPAATKGLR
ncbi:MAG: EVE domain-containing protein [Kofleriaceae bacterium]|nr:EVE domain-containing protein [Kofleriaceae bacterium]